MWRISEILGVSNSLSNDLGRQIANHYTRSTFSFISFYNILKELFLGIILASLLLVVQTKKLNQTIVKFPKLSFNTIDTRLIFWGWTAMHSVLTQCFSRLIFLILISDSGMTLELYQ